MKTIIIIIKKKKKKKHKKNHLKSGDMIFLHKKKKYILYIYIFCTYLVAHIAVVSSRWLKNYPQDTSWCKNKRKWLSGHLWAIITVDVLKFQTLYSNFFSYILHFMQLLLKIYCGMDNSVDPDQTIPDGAVWFWICTVCICYFVINFVRHFPLTVMFHYKRSQ